MSNDRTPPQTLTPKQARFCEEYVIDLNSSRAYRAAGYQVTTDNSTYSSASTLLRNPKVQAYISQLQAERGKRTEATSDRIINELAAIAFSRVTDTIQIKDGVASIKDSSDWLESSQIAIQQVDGENTTRLDESGEILVSKRLKVKHYDKLRALELLAKITGLVNEFDTAIATLKNYGIVLKRDPKTGVFILEQ